MVMTEIALKFIRVEPQPDRFGTNAGAAWRTSFLFLKTNVVTRD